MNCIRRNYFYYNYIWFIILFSSIYLLTFYLAVGNDNNLQTIAFYCLMFGIGGIFFNITTCCYYKRFHNSLFSENDQNNQTILPIVNTDIDIVHNNTQILCSIIYTEELLQPYDTNKKNTKLLPVALPVV